MATKQTCDSCNRAMERGLGGQGPIVAEKEGVKIAAAVTASKDGKPADLCLVCLRALLASASFPAEERATDAH